jgi:Xaa-Pro aminopeptidase
MNYPATLPAPSCGQFTTKQKEVYQIVLHAHQTAVAMLNPVYSLKRCI